MCDPSSDRVLKGPVQPDGSPGPMPGFSGAPWALISLSKPPSLAGMLPSQMLPSFKGATFARTCTDLHTVQCTGFINP